MANVKIRRSNQNDKLEGGLGPFILCRSVLLEGGLSHLSSELGETSISRTILNIEKQDYPVAVGVDPGSVLVDVNSWYRGRELCRTQGLGINS